MNEKEGTSWKRKNPFWKRCMAADFILVCLILGTVCIKMQERVPAMGTANTKLLETHEKKKIAITFDDGPHPKYTEQLLDGLKERDVVATFFVTGEHAALHPDIIERMNEEGHLIGNHTYTHIQLTLQNREKFKKELIDTNAVISKITGKEVLYVRPPYGTWDKSLEEELNMFPVLWNIDPVDWESKDSRGIARKVIAKAKEGGIILMHDYYKSSVQAALIIVDELKKEGYEFVTAEEILFD
ncbi:MAG: polysaccharide deacetylase family protein [Lachnospiraceae bacterium]|nr:polysaccharide deacetylase family protein [Lachnospiraceae bacterium]